MKDSVGVILYHVRFSDRVTDISNHLEQKLEEVNLRVLFHRDPKTGILVSGPDFQDRLQVVGGGTVETGIRLPGCLEDLLKGPVNSNEHEGPNSP